MHLQKKVNLSSSFLFTKFAVIGGVIFTLKMILNQSTSDPDFDLKTNLEYKLYFVVLSLLSIYFFTRPKISYDDNNLFIKKINKAEMVIPLKNIITIFYNPFALRRGGYTYSIEYNLNSTEENSIKFYLQANFLERLKNFINLVKVHNPNVEII